MKTTNLLLAVLCLAGLTAPACAQGKKALPAAVRALTQNTPTRLPGTKRFVFPKQFNTTQGPRSLAQLNAALQRNISNVQAAGVKSTTLPPLPAFALLSQGTAEKTFLELTSQEQAFYQQETVDAFNLVNKIKTLRKMPANQADEEKLLVQITEHITHLKNDYLRNMSLSLLEDGNLETLQTELMQYFSFGMPFEEAAFNYTLRHPYKRNLQTIRLLHNPFIAQEFKTPVLDFVSRPLIAVIDKEAFKTALHNLQAEYERILKNAKNTPAIQMQITYYEHTINTLTHFIQQNGRLPKWNTRSDEEQDLYNQVEYLLNIEKQYNYEPFSKLHENLRLLIAGNQPVYPSKQETLQAFEKFVQVTGLPYPRALRESADISWDEEQLFDNLTYWRTQDEPGVNKAIHDIQRQYLRTNKTSY